MADPIVNEVSGLVESRLHTNTLWVHNDSGDGANLYALSTEGLLLSLVTLKGVHAIDFEDLAYGVDSYGTPTLYIGDIGDNSHLRTHITLYQVPEPTWTTPPETLEITDFQSYALTYPDGPQDAETLLFDPLSEELIIITKAFSGLTKLYSVPIHKLGSQTTLDLVGQMQFGTAPLIGGTTTTGGDIGPNGHYVLIRTYTHMFMWKRAATQTVAQALQGAPCTLFPESEPQGEAVGFSTKGPDFFSISERVNQPIYRYESTLH